MIETLENSKVSLSFDTSSCSIISLNNKASGDEYIKFKNTAGIFSLTSIHEGHKNYIFPEKIKNTNISKICDGQELIIDFEIKDITVRATIYLKDDNDSFIWSIDISNNSQSDIVEVLYPRIRGMYLGGTWKDDIILLPHHAGEKTLNPAEEYLGPAFTGMSRAGTQYDGDVYFRELNYCGLASMMWMYYYDRDNGFYISSYDSDFYLTGLRAETSAGSERWMGFAIRKYIRIKANGQWRSNPYVTSLNCKDWHHGAREYRKWIEKYIPCPHNPEYLNDEYVLMNMYKFRREGQVYYKFKDIPCLFDVAKSFGIDHFFMAGWNRQGFDQNYPEYYPDLELGTSMDLYNGCKYIIDNGGIPTFYINARIFDINSDYFDTLGKRLAIKLQDGSMINEQYGEYKFTVSCPSNAEWQKYAEDTGYWMAKSYNAIGIYLDQLGSAEPYPCYDSSHTHDDIGLFNNGYLKILNKLKEQLSSINKKCFLMIENCGDIYGSYTWGNLTWNSDVRDEYFNLYKYTFPEHVQVNMINPQEAGDKKLRETKYYEDIERALVLGSVLWVNPLTKFSEDDTEMLDYLRKAINFRKQINSYIISSRFVDTDNIIDISGDVKVTGWTGNSWNLYIIGNNKKADGYFEVPDNHHKITGYTIDGNFIEPEIIKSDGYLRIKIPANRISYILTK